MSGNGKVWKRFHIMLIHSPLQRSNNHFESSAQKSRVPNLSASWSLGVRAKRDILFLFIFLCYCSPGDVDKSCDWQCWYCYMIGKLCRLLLNHLVFFSHCSVPAVIYASVPYSTPHIAPCITPCWGSNYEVTWWDSPMRDGQLTLAHPFFFFLKAGQVTVVLSWCWKT